MIARLNSVQAAAAFVALAGAVSAQYTYTVPASQSDVALVEAQWEASGLDASIQGGESLGQPLQAQGLLQVVYGNETIVPGQAYAASDVANQPTITIYPSAAAQLSTSNNYTLALVDFSSISDPDPQGEYRHFLANGVSTTSLSSGAFHIHESNRITDYAAPGPLPGTGPHRYAWLMFMEGANFQAPANLSTAGTAPGHWDFKAYVAQTGLGAPILASFFTVENGAPTVAAASTSAVNTATLAVSSAASSAAPTSQSGSGVAGAAAGSASSSPSSTGAASSVFAPAAGVLAAVAGLVAFLT